MGRGEQLEPEVAEVVDDSFPLRLGGCAIEEEVGRLALQGIFCVLQQGDETLLAELLQPLRRDEDKDGALALQGLHRHGLPSMADGMREEGVLWVGTLRLRYPMQDISVGYIVVLVPPILPPSLQGARLFVANVRNAAP